MRRGGRNGRRSRCSPRQHRSAPRAALPAAVQRCRPPSRAAGKVTRRTSRSQRQHFPLTASAVTLCPICVLELLITSVGKHRMLRTAGRLQNSSLALFARCEKREKPFLRRGSVCLLLLSQCINSTSPMSKCPFVEKGVESHHFVTSLGLATQYSCLKQPCSLHRCVQCSACLWL